MSTNLFIHLYILNKESLQTSW